MSKKDIIIKEKKNAIIYIVYELLKGRKLSTKEMSELVEKNQRTCQRYVKELEESDLPIRREGQKYYLNTDDGYLPIYLSKEKISMLYIALISFSAFGEDLKLVDEIIEQIEELVNPKDQDLLNSIKKNLIVKRQYEIVNDDKFSSYNVFMLLLEAFYNKRIVKIKYKKSDEYRFIDVYGFCLAKQTYYVNAYCHNRKSLRMFRVDRILECSLEEEIYTISKDFDLKKFYKYTWEVENSRKPFNFELLIFSNASYNVKEKKWCENQNIEENDDGSILFKGTTCSERELKKWILSFGSNIKVIKPFWLGDDIKKEIKKALKSYE